MYIAEAETASFSNRLESLGRLLKEDGYCFCATTPLTHARIMARGRFGAKSLQDIFGWNRLVVAAQLPKKYHVFLDDPDLF